MLYTREWVAEKYSYYNSLIWDNKLPKFSTIDFTITKRKNPWGQGGCKGWGRDRYGIPYAMFPILSLSNYYDAPEWVKINTLVHEMCHIYEMFCEPKYVLEAKRINSYTRDFPRDAHGTVFYEQAERVERMTGIQITRFVTQDELLSVSLNDDAKKRAQKKIDKQGGIDIFLYVCKEKNKNGKECLAYTKPTPNIVTYYKVWLSGPNSDAKDYMICAMHCKAYSPEAASLKLTKHKKYGGYSWTFIPEDINYFMDKYKIKILDFLMGDEETFKKYGYKSGKQSVQDKQRVQDKQSVQDKQDITPKEKIYKSFTIKFTSGRVLTYTNVTKKDVEDRLRKDFPKWSDAIINKFVNNKELYMEGKNKTNKLDFLIEKAVKRELKKQFKNTPEIEPFSDEEMSKLTGIVISN